MDEDTPIPHNSCTQGYTMGFVNWSQFDFQGFAVVENLHTPKIFPIESSIIRKFPIGWDTIANQT